MKKTPLQNVIDRLEKSSRREGIGNEEKRTLNMVISYLWDELENERQIMSEIFDSSKEENMDVTGKIWINKEFMDFQKFL
jgi:hypothetical protein